MTDVNGIIRKYEDAEKRVKSAKEGLAKLEAEQKYLSDQINEALSDFNKTYGTDLKTKEDLVSYVESLNVKIGENVEKFNKLFTEFENSWGGADDNR